MDIAEYRAFSNELTQSARQNPRVVGLIAVGSMSEVATVPDAWSDHDFFLIVQPGEQESFRTDLSWLPQPNTIALSFRDTEHGLKVVYNNGHLLEFAVFDPAGDRGRTNQPLSRACGQGRYRIKNSASCGTISGTGGEQLSCRAVPDKSDRGCGTLEAGRKTEREILSFRKRSSQSSPVDRSAFACSGSRYPGYAGSSAPPGVRLSRTRFRAGRSHGCRGAASRGRSSENGGTGIRVPVLGQCSCGSSQSAGRVIFCAKCAVLIMMGDRRG